MSPGAQFQEERAELEALLKSGIFARSPSLAQFLQYVCSQYFEGRAEEIKEYNVAVEALGRPPDFDQKKDSIVRVEAHRLRKRLQEYYKAEGASHEIHIQLPPGSYAPQFVRREAREGEASAASPDVWTAAPDEAAAAPPPEVAAAQSRMPRRALYGLGIAAVVAVIAFARLGGDRSGAGPTVSSIPPAPQDEIRIMAGSTAERYVDSQGHAWGSDRFFEGGIHRQVTPRPILRTRDAGIYYTRREGECTYKIPLKAGTYELRLHFAETVFGETNDAGGGESSRVFRVKVNGQDAFSPMDVLADAGGANIANVKVMRDVTPSSDGFLYVRFEPLLKEAPIVSGIELLPSRLGLMRPVRILARETGFTDSRGNVWSGDHHFQGGQAVRRTERVAGADEQELFGNERYGNFSYVIPVDQRGQYVVTFRFAEHWFGAGRPGQGGEGSRMFDVYCNGRALLRNFDVYAAAGGSLRAVTRTFRGLEPNAQGKLHFQFVPVRNYALINSIEVLDQADPEVR
jgi:hypothetical protein